LVCGRLLYTLSCIILNYIFHCFNLHVWGLESVDLGWCVSVKSDTPFWSAQQEVFKNSLRMKKMPKFIHGGNFRQNFI